eukprot:TRINITY_DN38207_c0_g1_i1.p1 TRINITY_DN38207_c0_g1~~TRINITY_DN38207_c0_g1_i1.p1  ORF type:complete len:699 (+),score=56.63 TRINITY_DN38207_c0_g1_i1:49-2097(+)
MSRASLATPASFTNTQMRNVLTPNTRPPIPPTPESGLELDTPPLELEHVIGYDGAKLNTAVVHPTATPLTAVFSVGKLVVISQCDDQHEQKILRGHDAAISAIDISPSGALIATGQVQSTRAKQANGYIIIWDYRSRTARHKLQGHPNGIYSLRFSPDDRWLMSVGADGRTFIWDVQTGELSGGIRDVIDNEQALGLEWGSIHEPNTRRQQYEFFVTYNTGVRAGTWGFDIKSMQYKIATAMFQVPGSGGKLGGFVRAYTSVALCNDDLLCGTMSSDVVVFNTRTKLYKTNFILGGGGVLSIAYINADGTVAVGCGDGSLTKIKGTERDWDIVATVQLCGGITSLSVSSDGYEILAATNSGCIYRIIAKDLTATLYTVAHTQAVTDVAVPRNRSDQFATSSKDGSIRVWDLSDYSILFEVRHQTVEPRCLVYTPTPDEIVAGSSDGSVKCYDITKGKDVVWSISVAHRNGVSSLHATASYYLTGGDDGVVRVWAVKSRECVAVLQNHSKRVTCLLGDNTNEAIIHTCSMDKMVITYDLAQNDGAGLPKKLTYKTDTECSGFVSMAQRNTGEHELVVATYDGSLLTYDIDYPQPVCKVTDTTRTHATSLSLSHSASALVTSQEDGTIVVYGLDRDKPAVTPLAQASCHSAKATKAVWTADGKQIISVGSDGEICIWNYYSLCE